jgi:hypothetical protein
MKYIAQYIKKICPEVVVTNSKTTESMYYQMEHNFVVRLSEHIGCYEKGKISIVKSFNTEDFIVMIDTSPFPMVKNREEVKRMIKNLYEFSVLTSLSKEYHTAKQKAELEAITEWDKFWSKACQLTANARFLTAEQKSIIKKYFNKGIRGESMINNIKKIKPTTPIENIEEMFGKIYETEIKEKTEETECGRK